ncbi:hypothetical protein [Streptomyces sp. NPDC097981]|uniref:hypothetical protein n=1 Tax=Streptomyces sp. NPDC097981 TaxID=3155428 RepID=UPI003331463D
MRRDERWAVVNTVLSFGVWGTLFWILSDPDLQGVREAIGWWMAAIAVAPVLLGVLGLIIFDEPGEAGGSCDSDGVHWTHGTETCGSARYGCGG